MIETIALPLWVIAIALIILTIIIVKVVKRVLINTVLGVIALLIVNWFGAPYGLKIAITFLTVIVSAVFGLAGVGALIILNLLGITIK